MAERTTRSFSKEGIRKDLSDLNKGKGILKKYTSDAPSRTARKFKTILSLNIANKRNTK